MNRKILSLFTLALLVLNAAGISLSAAPTKSAAANRQTDLLVAKLPASDAVVVIDARRVFDQALPQLLASKQALLAEITNHLNEFRNKTGIDPRRFDSIVVGANFKNRKENVKDYDVDFVGLARGSMNAGSLIAAAKLGSNAGYREEKLGERTIYIFTPKSVADKTLSTGSAAVVSGTIDNLPAEIAVSTLDQTT